MLTIALETSHRAASVAILFNAELTEFQLDPLRAHASDCLAWISDWFAEQGLAPQSIDHVIVGSGPGSYTGLRIGIATAIGLARGATAQAFAVPSGEALCWRELEEGQEAIYLLDARQDELYFAHYARNALDVEVHREACVLRTAELAGALPKGLTIFGDRKALELGGMGPETLALHRDVPPPNAGAVLRLGLQRLEQDGPHALQDIEPLYLRPFAAKVRRR